MDWEKDNYEEWKVVVWRAVRAFVATFIPTFTTFLTSVSVETITDKELLFKFCVSAVISGVSAGLVAFGKVLRDKFEEKGWIQKIPV